MNPGSCHVRFARTWRNLSIAGVAAISIVGAILLPGRLLARAPAAVNDLAVLDAPRQGSNITPESSIHTIGNIKCVSLYETSDVKRKHEVKRIEGALEKVLKLEGVTYYWNGGERTGSDFDKDRQIGFLAQDVERVLPEVVSIGEATGEYGISYGHIVPVVVEALKEFAVHQVIERTELDRRIEEQDKKIALLEARLTALEARK